MVVPASLCTLGARAPLRLRRPSGTTPGPLGAHAPLRLRPSGTNPGPLGAHVPLRLRPSGATPGRRPAPVMATGCGRPAATRVAAGGLPAQRSTRAVVKAVSSEAEAAGAVSYNGRFGSFVIDEVDEKEVFRYRVGLNAAAVGFVLTAASQLLPEAFAAPLQDPLCVLGAGGLGMALWEVHMYIGSIKRVMQALWLAGAVGAVGLAVAGGGDSSVASFVGENPWAVWLVGPMFAALTGLAFKEGACYGKFEAISLFFLVPVMCLSHLFSAPIAVQESLLVVNCVLMAVFGARKWTQEVKDDVGDKSVFMFQKMSEEEQRKLIIELGLTEEML